jgi:pimeloyl-ACP methyl ester carboxylesterase
MFLKSADADLFVTSFGAGPRTIVAHGGWVGSGELWVPPFEILSRQWRTVTYDHRGTGATVDRSERITLDLLVDDLFRVLDALEIGQCVLAGESAGAVVVLEAALRRPERFSGLVIVDGRYHPTPGAAAHPFIQGCKVDFPGTMEKFVAACVTDEDADAERARARSIVMRSNGRSAVQLAEAVAEVELESRLGNIAQPTLVIHGSKDIVRPPASSEELVRRLPNARLVMIEGAGHVPTMTRGAEVAAAIQHFFA